jgi:glyoxylase-like metal-dependent hydrolase (beta-lactamase superfamily II)
MGGVLDLGFAGRSGVIAAGVLAGPRGIALVDPGPASTVENLRRGLASQGLTVDAVRAILVTHIHLDHSGAVGTLLRERPDVPVYVHERGARHLVDPSKLLASASLLFGDRLHRLWGDVLPVPAANVQVVRGGEALDVAGLDVRVAYTPGHASHHVSYFDTAAGTAYIGDTGGIRVGAPLLVLPPTPPPDLDVEAWAGSLALIRGWSPRRLFISHFGGFDDVAAHLDDLERRLHEVAGWAKALLADPDVDDAQRQQAFADQVAGVFTRELPNDEWVRRYLQAMPLDHCWQGLAKYWRKPGAA